MDLVDAAVEEIARAGSERSYGVLPGAAIDSRRPFHVQADFSHKRVNVCTARAGGSRACERGRA